MFGLWGKLSVSPGWLSLFLRPFAHRSHSQLEHKRLHIQECGTKTAEKFYEFWRVRGRSPRSIPKPWGQRMSEVQPEVERAAFISSFNGFETRCMHIHMRKRREECSA